MQNGFNWRNGTLDSSVLIDPRFQHVRQRNPVLYRASIFTDDGARAEYRSRDMILPNTLNLRLNPRLPPLMIAWRAPPEFDDAKFNVTRRIRALAAEYRLVLQRDPARTSTAGYQRRASTERTNRLLPYPNVVAPRRPQRRSRRPAIVDSSSVLTGTHSEESPSSLRSGSCSSDSHPQQASEFSDSPRTGPRRQGRDKDNIALSDSCDNADGNQADGSESICESASGLSEEMADVRLRDSRHRRAGPPPRGRRRPSLDSTTTENSLSGGYE